MPRYHVDVEYDGRTIRDIYGVTLGDDGAGQSHALRMLATLARDHRTRSEARALTVLLRDQDGAVLYGATLWLRGEALRTPDQRGLRRVSSSADPGAGKNCIT